MKFPPDWPEGCPPNDAEDAAGDTFRLVKSAVLTAEDFLSHHETGKLPNAPPCLRCGLSLFRTKEDAEHQHRAYPKLGKFIAKAILTRESGKTKLTKGQQPTHTTWWTFVGVDRLKLFTETEIEEIG